MIQLELPPLATVEDLERHLGRQLTEAERAQAEAWLAAASASIRRLTGQMLSYVEEDHELHDGWWTSLIQLNQLPVVEVHSVSVEGQEVNREGWSQARSGWYLNGWRLDRENGNLWRQGGMWWAGRQGIEVVYSHGYKVLPADLVQVVTGMGGRALTAPAGDLRSEQLGPYRYDRGQLAGLGAVGMTAAERQIIDRFRVRRQVVQ